MKRLTPTAIKAEAAMAVSRRAVGWRSSCWNIIRTLESQLRYSLLERSQGGAGGSTSDLTQRGRELLERYNTYDKKLKQQANELYETYFGGLFE